MKLHKKSLILGAFLFVLLSVVLFERGQRASLPQGTAPDKAENASAPTSAIAPNRFTRTPASAPALAVGSQTKTDERFPGSVVLETSKEVSMDNGRFTRVELIQTKMKYPFLRVEKLWERDPVTQAETFLQRQEMVANHVIVELVAGKNEADLLQAINAVGGTIHRKLRLDYSATYLVTLPQATLDAVPDAVKTLSQFKDIFTFAEPDFVSHKTSTPDDSQFSSQWHLNNTGQTGGTSDADIDAPEAWTLQTGNNTIVIAISDTGIDLDHTDLQANIWSNPNDGANGGDDDGNGYVDDVHGWNFAYGTSNPDDDEGHGTFVAGVIGAQGDNALGIAGVCWHCKMMPLKTLDNFGTGFNSDIAEGFDYARTKGAKIINASHAGPTSLILQTAVNSLETSGVLLVAAVDNLARNEDAWVSYPACSTNRNIIAVAATDSNDGIAYFSNYGPKTVDLFAPGDSLWSAQRNNGYGQDSGTSFATPQVAGVAGLLKAQHPTWTVEQIKNAILNSVDLKPNLIGKCVSGGRLNAFRAVAGIYHNGPGSIDLAFNPKWTVTGSVLTMALQTNGKLILGGTFTNLTTHRIARLNADGAVDTTLTTGAGANGTVQSLVLQPDGKILIAGAFTKYNNIARGGIARLSTNGVLDVTFNPGTGANGTVNALVLQPDGKIIIAGTFTTLNGLARSNIARLNLNGSVDNSFNPPATGPIQSLALQSNGKILFGGNSIGRLKTDGTLDSNFNTGAGVDGTVRTIAIDSADLIYIGGDFTTYNTTPRTHIARLLSSGSLDDTFNPGSGANGVNATITAIALQDDCSVLASGTFTDFNEEQLHGSARTGIVLLNTSGIVDQNFNPGSGHSPGANAIAQMDDGRIYLGGAFTNYDGLGRRYVARIIGRDSALGTNSFSLSTTNLSFNSIGGGNDTVTVTTFGCAAWKTFVSSNDWISIVSGAVGFGTGDVVVSVAPNTNKFDRSATLTIAGKKVAVDQTGSLTPPSFEGRTIVLNELVFITSPASNTFVSRIADLETVGTFTYSRSSPISASIAIVDANGSATITLSFTTPTSGSYTNTRGSFGTFTLYPTRPDFDGDSRADLLWISSTNGLRTWLMDGTNFLGANRVAATKTQSTAWKLVALNDFNFDGNADLLWQNGLGNLSIWLLNKTNFQKSISFGSSATWKVIGMTDLNYDGKKDLVFQNGTGLLQCWFLNGTNRLGQIKLNNGKAVPLSLKPIGFDDFNGDGQADLLWQSTSNVLSVWCMNGTNFTSTNVLNGGASIDAAWKAVALNDFNYDGNPDLLFENTAGQLWTWFLSGTNTLDSFWLQPSQAVDPKWRIAVPK
ncbi:MAG: hypothetical protein JWM68_1712 [Verrucomicrobiales bacterium]|nr:hypothetical protein [Verrucomicrobiales bacterium]